MPDIDYSKIELHIHLNNNTAHSAVVKRGGVLQIINDDEDCPDFEVEFRNTAPPSPDDLLTGTVGRPVFLHMPDEIKEFRYYILHKHRDGRCTRGQLLFARTCGPCP